LDQILNIVVERLKKDGMDLDRIPVCIEALLNLISFYPFINCREANKKMQSLGWPYFEIDNHTFELVKLVYSKCETGPVLR